MKAVAEAVHTGWPFSAIDWEMWQPFIDDSIIEASATVALSYFSGNHDSPLLEAYSKH